VQDTIYDKFVAEAVKRFKAVKLGMPWDPDTQMGSQINEKQAQKIVNYIEIGKQEGATVAVGGGRATEGALANGAYVQPTLLTNVTNDMRVAREEIFGPVAVVIKFHDEDEVIAMANDSEYGLGGAVWTHDLSRAIRVSRAVETGRMWVNTYNQLPEKAPFGGYKKSGIGRETYKSILDNYSQVKNIFIDIDDAPSGFYPAPEA
jgi:acyl-CoA reductase-like NAD-dependent aldehyde dehydrogenase